MAAYPIHSLPHHSTGLAHWLAVAVTLVVLGASIPPAHAGDQPNSTGAVTTYVGQGWG